MKSEFDNRLFKNEEILWEDSPRFFNYSDKNVDVGKTIFEILGVLVFSREVLVVLMMPIAIAVMIMSLMPLEYRILTLGIPIIFFIKAYNRVHKSRYAITNKKVYIRIWNWWQIKERSIALNEIGATRLEIYENGSGVLHILPRKTFDFKGKSVIVGFSRHYPSIEMVKNLRDVQKVLRKAVKGD